MARDLSVEYDEDTAKVLLTIEDASGNFVQVRMSADKAVLVASDFIHAAKVAKWRQSGVVEAFGG